VYWVVYWVGWQSMRLVVGVWVGLAVDEAGSWCVGWAGLKVKLHGVVFMRWNVDALVRGLKKMHLLDPVFEFVRRTDPFNGSAVYEDPIEQDVLNAEEADPDEIIMCDDPEENPMRAAK
jgi:hypothetical protein